MTAAVGQDLVGGGFFVQCFLQQIGRIIDSKCLGRRNEDLLRELLVARES